MKKSIFVFVLFLLFTRTAEARNRHVDHRQRVSPPVTAPVPTSNEVTFTKYITSYASGDNDPSGSTAAYLNGVEGNAGGDGTYDNPITIAVGYVGSKGDYAYGTVFYISGLQAYFVAQDTCAACHKDGHLDVYAGDNSGNAILNCEYAMTGNYQVIQNPSPDYPVITGSLFQNGQCRI